LGTGEYWSNLYCLQKVTIVGFVTLPSTLFQQFCQFFSFPLFRQIHGTIANTIHTNQDFADVAVGLDDTLINATTATTTPVRGCAWSALLLMESAITCVILLRNTFVSKRRSALARIVAGSKAMSSARRTASHSASTVCS